MAKNSAMSEVELMLKHRNREKTQLLMTDEAERRSARIRRQIDENISTTKKELQELRIRTITPPPGSKHNDLSPTTCPEPQIARESTRKEKFYREGRQLSREGGQLSPDSKASIPKQARLSLPQPLLGDAPQIQTREKRPSMPAREGTLVREGRPKEDKFIIDLDAEPMKAKTRMNLKLSEKLTQSICKSSERRSEGTPIRVRSLSPRCLEELQKAATVLRNTEHEGSVNDLMSVLKSLGIETKAPGKS